MTPITGEVEVMTITFLAPAHKKRELEAGPGFKNFIEEVEEMAIRGAPAHRELVAGPGFKT